MKAKHEFKTQEDYKKYLVIYFSSVIYATKMFQDYPDRKDSALTAIGRADLLMEQLLICGYL